MKGEKKGEATVLLMEHLERVVLLTFLDAYTEHGKFTEEDKDYEKVKQGLVDKLGRKHHPENKVRRMLEAKLNQKKLLNSLKKINRLYGRAKLNKETKFSFLKSQLRDHKSLEQFVLCQIAATYTELLKVVADYKAESTILREPSKEVTGSKEIVRQ